MNVMQGKKQNQDESIHLFIIGGAGIRKNFTLIQGLSHFYKTHLELNLFVNKNSFMAYIKKQHLTLMNHN